MKRNRRRVLKELPIIDVSSIILDGTPPKLADALVRAIDEACRHWGFFIVVGHGIDPSLLDALDKQSREFFSLPEQEKAVIAMDKGGRAWRGWFPVGNELTSGRKDGKEGVYFGTEVADSHPKVVAKTPLWGKNLFPNKPRGLKESVLSWMDAVKGLGETLLRCMACGLNLEENWFAENLTKDPTLLFRIFHYPPSEEYAWGVGEHTDYGLLTLLAQDDCGGLQVKIQGEEDEIGGESWIDVPSIPGAIVVNLGDQFERLTCAQYKSTPHRVKNTSGKERLSFPLFFDPSWDSAVPILQNCKTTNTDNSKSKKMKRWDGENLLENKHQGVYGEYLVNKVAKVFPELFSEISKK